MLDRRGLNWTRQDRVCSNSGLVYMNYTNYSDIVRVSMGNTYLPGLESCHITRFAIEIYTSQGARHDGNLRKCILGRHFWERNPAVLVSVLTRRMGSDGTRMGWEIRFCGRGREGTHLR